MGGREGSNMTKQISEVEQALAKQITSEEELGNRGISIHGLGSSQLIICVHSNWFVITSYVFNDAKAELDLASGCSPIASETRPLVHAGLLSRQAYDDQNKLNREKELAKRRLVKEAQKARLEKREQKEYERLKRKFEGKEQGE